MNLLFLISKSSYIINELNILPNKNYKFLNSISDLEVNMINLNTIIVLDFKDLINYSQKESRVLNKLINLKYKILFISDTNEESDIHSFKKHNNIRFLDKNLLTSGNFLKSIERSFSQYKYELLTLDFNSKSLFINDVKINLTSLEYKLLKYFIQHKNQLLTRKKLIKEVWGYSFLGSSRTIDTHIKSLRKKIHPYRNLIKTVWGKGYIFRD